MAISAKTRKTLWALSGNQCAICKTPLVHPKDDFNHQLIIGEECHIISEQANGPRHQKINNFDYDDSSNLLLLCCNHHRTVDERVNQYSVDILKNIKLEHEKYIASKSNSTNKIDLPKIETQEKQSLADFVISKHDKEINLSKCEQIMWSKEGLKIALAEAQEIKKLLYKEVTELKSKASSFNIHITENKTYICNIVFKGHTFLAQYNHDYDDSADKSYLLFGIVKGLFDSNGYCAPFQECTMLKVIRLDFAFNEFGQFGWREQEGGKTFHQSLEISQIWLEKFFKTVLQN
jgi:hypothetical protein